MIEDIMIDRREKGYGAIVVAQLFFGIIFGFISISKTTCYSNCNTNSFIYSNYMKYAIYFCVLSCIVLSIIGIINMVKNKSNYFLMRISLIIDTILLILLEV